MVVKKVVSRGVFIIAALLGLCHHISGQTMDYNSTGSKLRNLLEYRDQQNITRPVTTVGEWEIRRCQALERMMEITGPLPNRDADVPFDIQVEEEIDYGSYVRRRITYRADPDDRVPAFLLIPKVAFDGRTSLPAVLALHSTSLELGYRVVVEPGRLQNRDFGHQLAVRGFVVLAPSYPLMADYQPDLKKLGYSSGTMKAIWNNIRGLDLLDELPYVRHQKYGVIGHSLGGHNTIFTAVFDPRIKVIVSSCGFDSFLDYKNGDLSGWTQERYMPRLVGRSPKDVPFDFDELIAALAPRKVFVNAPLHDDNFKWESVERIRKAAGKIFALYGAEDNLVVRHPDCQHDFPDEVKEHAFETLEEHLKTTVE